MAKVVNRLSDRAVKALKEPGLHADGNGLYLEVDKSGAKRWAFIFQWQGSRKQMGLGSASTITLVDARAAAQSARKEVLEGINPIEARKARAAALVGQVNTFGAVAGVVIETLKLGWRNARHEKQWKTTLEEYVTFRDKPVGSITTDDVLSSLKPIWLEIPTTARRLRGRIERVLDAATAKNLRSGENPARWRGHLKHLLPAQPAGGGHHTALPYDDAPGFYDQVRGWPATPAVQALQFVLLTLCRTNEVRGARWGEFDFVGNIWTVPAERMKLKQEHVVPLVDAAVQLLLSIRPEDAAADDFVFPGRDEGKPIGKSGMEKVLLRYEIEETTVHGLRSTFSDWAHDTTDYPEGIIEQCLAHVVGSATKRAYRRKTALVKRRQLLTDWATYLGSAAS